MTKQKALCTLDEIEVTGAFGVDIIIDGEEKSLILVKDQDHSNAQTPLIRAYENRCPHLHIPLEMAPHAFLDRSNPAFLVCSTHGARFEVSTGSCILGPCHGDSLTAIKIRLEGNSVFLA